MRARSSKGNVFVGNLPPDFSDERLAEAFDPYGIVLSAVVARDPSTGARLRYGFVDITTERAATQAISALDGVEIDGCKLNVKASEKKSGAKKPGAGPGRRPPFRPAPPRRTPIPATARPVDGDRPPADLTEPPVLAETPARPAQSSVIAASLEEMGPPPRRDFEVAYKPARRKTTPSFQVERRSLPRRG
jgi:RNA recognition motif-containing protein